VLLHIQRHLDDDLPLDELARVAAFSPYHFHRIFRGMLGESVKEHIRRLRLERAAMRLKYGDTPVTTIAFEAGYETHEAFTRAFKAMRGLSPSAFRSSSGNFPPLETPKRVHYREGSEIENFEPVEPGGEIMEVTIRKLEPMRLAFVRHIGPYKDCGAAWDKLCARLGKQGRLGPDTKYIGMCYDDPDVTPADKIRYDACATVDGDFEAQGDIGVVTVEGGEYAFTTHLGPYEKLSETYAQLMGQQIPKLGRDCRHAPSLEFYLTDPENTDPEDYVTDIYAPLEPR
jgi:AraC family transcriptional regulator